MSIVILNHGLVHISTSKEYRLRLEDGTCVFVLWHNYHGPDVYKDRAYNRPINDWFDNKMICDQIGWLSTKRDFLK